MMEAMARERPAAELQMKSAKFTQCPLGVATAEPGGRSVDGRRCCSGLRRHLRSVINSPLHPRPKRKCYLTTCVACQVGASLEWPLAAEEPIQTDEGFGQLSKPRTNAPAPYTYKVCPVTRLALLATLYQGDGGTFLIKCLPPPPCLG